mgnify:CR=1 FL=1
MVRPQIHPYFVAEAHRDENENAIRQCELEQSDNVAFSQQYKTNNNEEYIYINVGSSLAGIVCRI